MVDQPELTISKLVRGLPRLKQFEEILEKYEEEHPFQNQWPVVDRNTFLGIEVEVENVHDYVQNNYWMAIEDGSLRNRGREFITHPLRAFRAERALTLLKHNLNSNVDFSERTSVHIHMNVRTLTMNQLINFIYLYLVFEKAFFDFVGHDRINNIFCSPLQESDVQSMLQHLILHKTFTGDWCKYTALNILPITSKGTVEFRHMHGTLDVKKLMQWINLILCLKKYALKQEPDRILNTILDLNTNSTYRMFAEEVFGIHVYNLDSKNFDKNLAEGVKFVKQIYANNPFVNEVAGCLAADNNSPLGLLMKKFYQPTAQGLSFDRVVLRPRREGEPILSPFTTSTFTHTWGNSTTIRSNQSIEEIINAIDRERNENEPEFTEESDNF